MQMQLKILFFKKVVHIGTSVADEWFPAHSHTFIEDLHRFIF